MPRAGSYLLGQAGGGLRPGVPTGAAPDAAPGLSAMVVSRPASGANELWDGGPGFDREYVLVYEDADLRDDVPAGPVPYEPNFFTVNGLAFPDLAGDSDSVVAASLGERILIRTGNLGGWVQAIHFHGFHVDIVARNNAPETVLPPKDTYRLPSNKTVDVILTASQVGVYPLHPHSLTTTTANGHYPFGQITLIQIT
jgi:FtsP/CotA-like multicopper oxidase with cupredoxin domain